MGMKVTKRYFCDICGEEIKEFKKNDHTLIGFTVRFLTEQNEGTPTKPYYDGGHNLMLCSDCMERAVTVEATGAMGHNHYRFRDNDATGRYVKWLEDTLTDMWHDPVFTAKDEIELKKKELGL
mgnify:CR=1 FL=1